MQYRVTCQKIDSDPSGHEVRIKFDVGQITSSTKLNDLAVKVSCSCPAFLYWGAQWHLHEKDSLEGTPRPLLQAPTEQLDKRTGYLICKHVKVVSDRIIPSVSRVINDVARKLKVEEYNRKQEEDILKAEEEMNKPSEEFKIEDDKSPKEWFLGEKPEPKGQPQPTPKVKTYPSKSKPKPHRNTEITQIKRPGTIK